MVTDAAEREYSYKVRVVEQIALCDVHVGEPGDHNATMFK